MAGEREPFGLSNMSDPPLDQSTFYTPQGKAGVPEASPGYPQENYWDGHQPPAHTGGGLNAKALPLELHDPKVANNPDALRELYLQQQQQLDQRGPGLPIRVPTPLQVPPEAHRQPHYPGAQPYPPPYWH